MPNTKSHLFDSRIDAALRVARWRRVAGRLISAVNIAMGVVGTGLLGLLSITAIWSIPEYLRVRGEIAQGSHNFLEQIGLGLDRISLEITLLVPFLFYATIYLLPFLFTLPASGPLIGLWSGPPRFVLLRPFNRGHLSKPLRRIMRRHAGSHGHLYTLSDADMKVPWFVRVPLLIGQLALFSFRARRIRGTRGVQRLGRAVVRTWLRNINWCLAFGKAFPVASADHCWQDVVRTLVEHCHVILFDVTELRPSAAWELEHCIKQQRGAHMILMAHADAAIPALARLRAARVDVDDAHPLFLYQDDRLVDPEAFERRLTEVSLRATGSSDAPRGNSRERLIAIATAVLFSCQLIPLLGLAVPHRAPWFPHWNETSDTTPWPALAEGISDSGLTMLGIGVLTLVLLADGARQRKTMKFLVVVQLIAVALAPLGLFHW